MDHKINIKNKRALITGLTGFVGLNLAKRLVDDGWEVHAILRPNSNLKRIDPIKHFFNLHTHDGTTEQLRSILSGAKPAVVFHLASLFLAQHTAKDVEPLIRSNIVFSTQLVEAMVANGIFHLVNTGTFWQHYQNQAYNPVCLYAATKQAFEAIIRYYVEATSLKVVTLKLFDTYGPKDPRPKLLNILRRAGLDQTHLDMSPGQQQLDLVYIDDVVEAFVLAAERVLSRESADLETFAVSSGKLVSLKDLVRLYERANSVKLRIKWGARRYREREIMSPWNKGVSLPGWLPKVGLAEGLRKAVADNEE